MDASTARITCRDVYDLVAKDSINASRKLKGSDELTFALECIRHVDNGLGYLPADEKLFFLLKQRITSPLKKSNSQQPLGYSPYFQYFGASGSSSSSEDSTLSDDSIESSDEQIELPDGLEEEINAAVQHFLFPYISNRITPEQDAQRTIPFSATLSQQLCEKYGVDKSNKHFQITAIYYYIEHATKGLYTNNHIEINRTMPCRRIVYREPKPVTVYFSYLTFNERIDLLQDFEYAKLLEWYEGWLKDEKPVNCSQFSKPVLILFHALFPALKKDFPKLNLDPDKIINLTLEMIEKVEKKRKIIYLQRLQEVQAIRNAVLACSKGGIPRAQLLQDMKETECAKNP